MRLFALIFLLILILVPSLKAQEYVSSEYNCKVAFPDNSVDRPVDDETKKSGIFVMRGAPSGLGYELGFTMLPFSFHGRSPFLIRNLIEKLLAKRHEKVLSDDIITINHTRTQSFLIQVPNGQLCYELIRFNGRGDKLYELIVVSRKTEDPRNDPEVQDFLDSFTILVDDSDPNESPDATTTDASATPEPVTPKDYPFPDQHCHLQVLSDWVMQPYNGFLLYGQSADRKKTVGLQVSPMDSGADLNDPTYIEKWKNDFAKQGYTFLGQAVKTLNGTSVLYTQGQRKTGDNVRSFAMILALAHNQSYVLRVGVDGTDLPGSDLQDILNSFHIDP